MANPFDGRRVAGIVALLVALTAVIPPAAAYGLARWRISHAGELAAAAAGPLAMRKQDLKDAAGTQPVVCGPGRLPDASGPGREWLQSPVAAGHAFDTSWPRDPWGRCYLLNARALLERGSGLLISAGPNGTIDTPLDAASPSGDDIGAVVR